jgi:hypothetical protein
MIFGSIGTVSSSWNPPIPMAGLVNWYEPGNTAGITIGTPDTMENLAPSGSSSDVYEQTATSSFGTDFIGATTLTTNVDPNNTWINTNTLQGYGTYTFILISKYNNSDTNEQRTTISETNGNPFNLGNIGGNMDVCIMEGFTVFPGNTTNTEWAMYTVTGDENGTTLTNFYRNSNLKASTSFKSLPKGIQIFPNGGAPPTPPTSSSVGAILIYDRVISDDEISSIYQHYKQRFGM